MDKYNNSKCPQCPSIFQISKQYLKGLEKIILECGCLYYKYMELMNLVSNNEVKEKLLKASCKTHGKKLTDIEQYALFGEISLSLSTLSLNLIDLKRYNKKEGENIINIIKNDEGITSLGLGTCSN